MEICGKTALITGAAKRVGRAIALRLAQKGAQIVLHYHQSKGEALKTQKEIESFGVHCHLAQANLSKTEHILGMTQDLSKNNIKVDILVNSASLFYKTPLQTATESDWDQFMDVNLKSYFTLSRELGLQMKKNSRGRIINIADWSGFRPYKDYAPYCVSKGGLITLTKTLALDLAPNVLVNAVAPGPVSKPEDLPEEENQKTIQKTILGRWGKPEDVAHAVSFLIESDFINGTVLVVDGGRSIV